MPLLVAAGLAEQRSVQLHLERHGRWTDSPKALLAALLNGSMTEAELHGQLVSRGMPLPAAKVVVKKVEARPRLGPRQGLARAGRSELVARCARSTALNNAPWFGTLRCRSS